jgi:hypothetical protein
MLNHIGFIQMAITLPEIDKVEYLVRRKFPNAIELHKAVARGNIFGAMAGTQPDDEESWIQKDYKKIKEYEAELRLKPKKEIDEFYKSEWQKDQEEREKSYFFNKPESQADNDHWSKMQYWSIDEAIALSFGKSPERVKWKALDSYEYTYSNFVEEYRKLVELTKRAVTWKKLYDPVLPPIFIKWCKDNDISFSQELEELVIKRQGNWYDWKKEYEKVNAAYDELQKKYSDYLDSTSKTYDTISASRDATSKKYDELLKGYRDVVADRDKIIKTLSDKIKTLEADKTPLISEQNKEKPLSTRERGTLLKILIAMAIDKYGYTPYKNNPASTDICDATNHYDIKIGDETIRKWLEKAVDEVLPQDAIEKPKT